MNVTTTISGQGARRNARRGRRLATVEAMSSPSPAPMSRSERKKAKTASAILDAAEFLFRLRGFQTTTVDEIAERADVSVGSVYVHFENKANLYFALVERALAINEAAM